MLEDNPGLRTVVDKAKASQMPKDTMERAIARGAGGLEGSELVSLTYEGYGPGGVAFLGGNDDRQPQPHGGGGPACLHQSGGESGHRWVCRLSV